MKKVMLTMICFIVISLVFPYNVSADIGPKPSVVIDFQGFEDEVYYVTLLASVTSTGPFSVGSFYGDHMGDYDVFHKFASYEDVDSYHFLSYYQNCTETNRFAWTYFPPQEFKVLIYFPTDDSFIVSKSVYERYAFDSYFQAEITKGDNDVILQGEVTLVKSYQYGFEIASFLVRIVLTIAIELFVAMLFGFKGKVFFRYLVSINVTTQIILNVALNAINYYMGSLAFVAFYILLEIIVLIIEAIFYVALLKSQASTLKLLLYALIANGASFILGMALAFWLPMFF